MSRSPQTPLDANLWLRTQGWDRVNPQASMAALWQRGGQEVLVPLNTEAVDFERRWSELLDGLGRIHELSPISLAQEFQYVASDVSEWAAWHPSLIDHSIPVAALHTLTGTVRSAVVASANATISPRGYFGHSIPHQARDAADNARAGQTREGSYVIPVISRLPVAAPARDGMFDLDVALQPYARQVMDTMATALGTIHELAVQAGKAPTPRVINESVREGVSYELCAALADTLEEPAIGELRVGFKWAKALPRSRGEVKVAFPSESRSLVRGMADTLKGSPVLGAQRLVGYVKRLDREQDDERGQAILRTTIGGVQRSVRLELTEDQFHSAALASDNRRTVYVSGTMERASGRMWEFKDLQSFGIVDELSLDQYEDYLNEAR